MPYNSSADSPSTPEISAGVVVKVLDLYAKFANEMGDAAEECSDAAKNFTNSRKMALAIASAKGNIVDAIYYLDQAITACGNYGEMRELKSMLSEIRSKLSPMATYSLDGSLNNSTEFMLDFLEVSNEVLPKQEVALAEIQRLSKLVQG